MTFSRDNANDNLNFALIDLTPGRVYEMHHERRFDTLVGMTIVEAERTPEGLRLRSRDGRRFAIYHQEDCSESVDLLDVCGDIADLVGSPITVSERRVTEAEVQGENQWGHAYTSASATFIELATVQGSVTLRYYGASNGYYSETADLIETVMETHTGLPN